MINWGVSPEFNSEVNLACALLDARQTGRRLFAGDSSLWRADTEQVRPINQCLGWLTLPDRSELNAESIIAFALQMKTEHYMHAVLLGMGGSSLCSEVARETFDTAKGYLTLFVLDDTDPSAIMALESKINLEKTLFIVASKSGNTKETISFFHYFHNQLLKKNKKNPGANFIAITDDSTPLVKLAEQYRFRKVFITPSDIGGRYSVLSDFGLVPMALMGIDINAILTSAAKMKNNCEGVPAATNPSIRLGVILGVCQQHGKDKVSFILSSSIKSFGYWVEQLLAESTGKEGRGLIPVNGEQTGVPAVYGNDRIFIHMYLPSDDYETDAVKLRALEKAGHPIVSIEVANKIALGGEYYRWEIAAAVAGIVIGINPFDQPDVEQSKKNTDQLLKGWLKKGTFDEVDNPGKDTGELVPSGKFQYINRFIAKAQPNDYIALLPYFLLTTARIKLLQIWRQEMRDGLKVATTLLNGPRYLHSTGQLHKGGPDSGIYIILIGDGGEDLSIPGEKFGFATLHRAQALGDFRSLKDKGRRVILVGLGKNIDVELDTYANRAGNSADLKIHQEVL